MSNDKKQPERVSAYVSHWSRDELMKHVFEMKIPVNRLLAYCLDQELAKEKPFDGYTYRLTDEVTLEYAYIDQAQLILKYMQEVDGMGYDQLLLLRHDIGVPDINEFAFAFKECVEKGFLESYKPKKNPIQKTDYPGDYRFYRLISKSVEHKRKVKRYEKLQKLKKEFKDV